MLTSNRRGERTLNRSNLVAMLIFSSAKSSITARTGCIRKPVGIRSDLPFVQILHKRTEPTFVPTISEAENLHIDNGIVDKCCLDQGGKSPMPVRLQHPPCCLVQVIQIQGGPTVREPVWRALTLVSANQYLFTSFPENVYVALASYSKHCFICKTTCISDYTFPWMRSQTVSYPA